MAPTVPSQAPTSPSEASTAQAGSITPPAPQAAAEALTELVSADTPQEIEQAINAIAENLATLTEEELTAIAQTLSVAPPEVKKAFEAEINIFGGGLDTYVPLDSTVTVGQRRVLVAVGAIMVASPAVVRRK